MGPTVDGHSGPWEPPREAARRTIPCPTLLSSCSPSPSGAPHWMNASGSQKAKNILIWDSSGQPSKARRIWRDRGTTKFSAQSKLSIVTRVSGSWQAKVTVPCLPLSKMVKGQLGLRNPSTLGFFCPQPLCGTRDPSSLPYIPSPRIVPCLRLQLPLNSWEDLGRGFHSSLGLWQEEQGPPLGPQNRSILRWGRANISSWTTRMFGSLWDQSTGPARSHSGSVRSSATLMGRDRGKPRKMGFPTGSQPGRQGFRTDMASG